MNQKNTTLSQLPTTYLERPAAAMLTPEYLDYLRQTVRTIGRLTRRSFRCVTGAFRAAFKYLNERWIAAQEMDARLRAVREARSYCQDSPLIRGML